MKYYLSSFKIGNEIEKLKTLIPPNKKTAYISNALDFADGKEWVKKFTEFDLKQLSGVGLDVEPLDLRKYFNNHSRLRQDINNYGVIWVSGGNVFVLRQAMRLSSFDDLLHQYANKQRNILYAGYSAGVCILSPSLKGLELVDSTDHRPYAEQIDIVWDGLNLIDYYIVPHFQSDHPESEAVNQLVEYYKQHDLTFKTLKDGEAIIIEG